MNAQADVYSRVKSLAPTLLSIWADSEADMHAMDWCTCQPRPVCTPLISKVHAAMQICTDEGTSHD